MNLLHLDASVLGDHSVSRRVSAAIVDPSLKVTYRDLAADPLLHFSAAHAAVLQGQGPPHLELDGRAALDDFLAADCRSPGRKIPAAGPLNDCDLPRRCEGRPAETAGALAIGVARMSFVRWW